ncbi:MAG: hypothetical protein OEY93_00915 [Anaerolineae bacterium]|nr:hypothetical protein [Anaerolineae bacterium]
MTKSSLEDTKPTPLKRPPSQYVESKPRRGKIPPKKTTPNAKHLLAGVVIILSLALLTTLTSWIGYSSGAQTQGATSTVLMNVYLNDQLVRAQNDIQAGQFELAHQRLEHIIDLAPGYPGAAEALVDLTVRESTTATPTPFIPTVTPTPDLRPAEELLQAALVHTSLQEWELALGVLAALRDKAPNYATTQVDDLIYLSLRNQGVDKILNQGRLESGLYDLTLAEQFGPLDIHANNYRVWARLYILGNSFWGAYPETAAEYYGQLSAAVPNFSDTSGETAFYRYWQSLVQIADASAAKNDWCTAKSQYLTALQASANGNLALTATEAGYRCPTPTATPTITVTPAATNKPVRPKKPTKTTEPTATETLIP